MTRHNQSTKAWIWEGSAIALLALIGQIAIIMNPLGG